MRLRKRHLSLLLFAIYLAAVMTICFLRPGDIPPMRQFILGIPTDKVIHFLMFLPYPLLAYISFRPDSTATGRHFLTLAGIIAVGVMMAMGVEKLQVIAERNYDIKDFYANIAGIATGTIITIIAITTQQIRKHLER